MAVVPQLEGENSWNEIHASLSTPGKNLVVYHCSRQRNKTFLTAKGKTEEPGVRIQEPGAVPASPAASLLTPGFGLLAPLLFCALCDLLRLFLLGSRAVLK